MISQNWELGHCLTEGELEEYYEEVHLEPVFYMSPQPTPGVAFSEPEGAAGIFKSTDGEFFEVLGANEEEPAQIRFMGRHLKRNQAVQLVADFVMDESFETQVAVHFHFDPSRFEAKDDMVQYLPDFFWVETEWLQPDHLKAIDEQLLAKSGTYRTLVEFLENPNLDKFEDLKKQVTTLMDFSSVYLPTE